MNDSSDGEKVTTLERSRSLEQEGRVRGQEKPQKDPAEAKANSHLPWYKRPLAAGMTALVLVGLGIGAVLFWRHSRHYEATDDAYVDVVSQRVSPQVPGRVLRVLVDDNQDVAVGTTLVELDPADYQSRVDQAKASVGQAVAQQAEIRAQQHVFEAQLAQAHSNVNAAEANRTNTDADLKRYRELNRSDVAAVSQQQVDRAEAAATNAIAQVEVAKKAVVAAEAQLGYARSQAEAAEAQVKSAQAQLQQAELNLSYTHLKAQVSGRVARKTVAPGNNVQAGLDLMAIVPREVFVTANFKETQLRHMVVGQPARILVDAYPDLKLDGHVDSLQPGTGQAFSALPAENATGNWVKVVQRVPVKIIFEHLPDDPKRRLAPGMSAEVTVTVR